MSDLVRYRNHNNDPIAYSIPNFSKKKIYKRFKYFKNYPNYLVVSVVVYKKSRFYGCNTYKTSPCARKEINNIVHHSIHAEQAALAQLPRSVDYSKVKIYTLRIPKSKNRKYSLARPCIHCQQTMLELGIKAKNVFYTDNESNWRCLYEYDR